jgi:hypothetical protein
MSSIAKTLVGSVIAIVSVLPERLSGMIWYLRAVSVLLAQQRGDLLVLDEPHLDEVVAELPAVRLLLAQGLLKLLGGDQLLL